MHENLDNMCRVFTESIQVDPITEKRKGHWSESMTKKLFAIVYKGKKRFSSNGASLNIHSTIKGMTHTQEYITNTKMNPNVFQKKFCFK